MADLLVIVPSRGRPEAVREMAEAFRETCLANTRIRVVVDDNDPCAAQYREVSLEGRGADVSVRPSRSMVEALNLQAVASVNPGLGNHVIGFMGDDHRPRTVGWDLAYLEALGGLGTGIVYGDDMLQGRRLPTQCAMTADIVQTLGYMAPPTLTHMYVDNFWLSLGEQAQCIRYLPDVVVEHRHPTAGKAQWDDGYLRVNHPGMYAKDETAFSEYCHTQLLGDVQKVQALRAAHV